MEFFVLSVIVLMIYFIPALQASSRKHNNTLAIFTLNFLLGWTMIGWAIALIWASTDNVRGK